MVPKLLDRLIRHANASKLPSVIIGGLALPAYNIARTTIDIGFCIYAKTQKSLDKFIAFLAADDIFTAQNPQTSDILFVVFTSDHDEAEVWLTPCDRFRWDPEMVHRILHFTKEYCVLSPEDFITAKLGRAGRAETDIDDVMQIVINNATSLDWKYLEERVQWAGLNEDLRKVLSALRKYDPEIARDIPLE